MRHLILLIFIYSLQVQAIAPFIKTCLYKLGLVATPLNRTEMVKVKMITDLNRFAIGEQEKKLIKALEECKFNDAYHPFLDRNSLAKTHSESFLVPQLTEIFLRGVKEFKKTEEKHRARYEITLNDGQKAFIYAVKQNYEGSHNYTPTAIDPRPIHFHMLIERGDKVFWAAMRHDLNNFSREIESLRIKSLEPHSNILTNSFNERWDQKEDLPDPFVTRSN